MAGDRVRDEAERLVLALAHDQADRHAAMADVAVDGAAEIEPVAAPAGEVAARQPRAHDAGEAGCDRMRLGNVGGVGYFGYAYFEQNQGRLKALSIDGVAPSPETIANGRYPLARPLFIYINAEALRRPQVQRFALYFVANAGRLAQQVGYVALPETAYAAMATRVRERTAGTAFGGRQEVGVSIDDVIARPLSSEAAAE